MTRTTYADRQMFTCRAVQPPWPLPADPQRMARWSVSTHLHRNQRGGESPVLYRQSVRYRRVEIIGRRIAWRACRNDNNTSTGRECPRIVTRGFSYDSRSAVRTNLVSCKHPAINDAHVVAAKRLCAQHDRRRNRGDVVETEQTAKTRLTRCRDDRQEKETYPSERVVPNSNRRGSYRSVSQPLTGVPTKLNIPITVNQFAAVTSANPCSVA